MLLIIPLLFGCPTSGNDKTLLTPDPLVAMKIRLYREYIERLENIISQQKDTQ